MHTVQRMLTGTRICALTAIWLATNLAVATPNNWTGGGDGVLWSDGLNWSAGVPGTGHEVTVAAGSLLLANETAQLASFTMTGGTLTFTNWMTRLRATDILLDGTATLTLPLAFTETQMSNRVWLVCSDLTLGVNAKIEVTQRGYAGGGNGPGWAGIATKAGGGSYGGRGCLAGGWTSRGVAYGSAVYPTDPGTGAHHANGHAGGAVLFEATGHVAIFGKILANGVNSGSNSSGGSGGAILIHCLTFGGGTGGELSVVGGGSAGGFGAGGAGGRIAVHYDSPSQALQVPANPGVKFSAGPGVNTRGPDSVREAGTLYLPDLLWLTSSMGTQWNDVRLCLPESVTEWEVSSLTLAGKIAFDPPVRTMRVNGDVTIANGGKLFLDSMPTNALSPAYGFHLDIGGAFTLQSGATLALRSAANNGAAPYVECGSLDLQTGALIDADGRGYDYSAGPSWNKVTTLAGGGGYGGQGGARIAGQGGKTYGYAHAPSYPGSGGAGAHAGRGGGLVRLGAHGAMRVDGTIRADGMKDVSSNGSGGSGGGILLTAQRFTGTGALRIKGGDSVNLGRGGGGGRIAVWTPFVTVETLNDWAETGHLPSATDVLDPAETWPSLDLVIDPGVSNEYYPSVDFAQEGTIFFGILRLGTLFMIQ